MSGTITTRLNITIENGNFRYDPPEFSSEIVQATQGGETPGFLAATTSEADIAFGGSVSPGRILLFNLDATNKLQYGPKSGGSMVALGEIEPGDFEWFTLKTGTTLRYRSNTGTVNFLCLGFNK